MGIKVAINGFGRIGRMVLRAISNDPKYADIDVCCINDLTDAATLAYLFKYDSVFGVFNGTVSHKENAITINGKEIKILAEKNPGALPWKAEGIDVVGNAAFRRGC